MGVLLPKSIPIISETRQLDKGKWVVSDTVTSFFIGTCHDFTGYELNHLPVGDANIGHIKVYSNTPLKVVEQGSSDKGDVVIWEGKKWELIYKLHHSQNLIPHYKYLAEYRGIYQ